MSFINWGGETPEQLVARRKLEEIAIYEQIARMAQAKQRAGQSPLGFGGSVTAAVVGPGPVDPVDPGPVDPVDPTPEPMCTDEICIIIVTKADGQVLLNNVLPTDCTYEVLVNPTTKYLLDLDNIAKTWQLLDNKVPLAENAELFGAYTPISPNITKFEVLVCDLEPDEPDGPGGK
jgi:hypothetical protein